MTRSPAESTKPAAATPTPARGALPAASRIASTSASSTRLVTHATPGRRTQCRAHDPPRVVDHSRQHLGAADVDPDHHAGR